MGKVTGDTVIKQLASSGQALCPVRLDIRDLTWSRENVII